MPTADSYERMAAAKAKAKAAAPKTYTNTNTLQGIASASGYKSVPSMVAKQTGATPKVLANPVTPTPTTTKPTATPTPTPTPAGGVGNLPANTAVDTGPNAESLYIDPTSAYQPLLDYLSTQTQAAKDRYAQNKQSISNIFGDLTRLTGEDSARITKQFTDSITSQQMNLATRTAEARAGAAAGTEQAVATGAERGEGPAMNLNPVQVAAEEGIGRSNEYATTWQALQNANQQQAMADISARGAGYGQQEVGAITQLAQNLEDKLLAIGGNTAEVQSDIAKAKLAGQQTVANAKYETAVGEQSAAAKAASDLAAQQAKYNYDLSLYGAKKQIDQKYAPAPSAPTAKKTTYAKNATGWAQSVNDAKYPGASASNIIATVGSVVAAVKSDIAKSGNTSAKLNKQRVIDKLTAQYAGTPWLTSAIDYVNYYSGVK
jgi:hypothetical protein